jgi:hypothetical protein
LNLQAKAVELPKEIELLVKEIGDLDDRKVQIANRLQSVKGCVAGRVICENVTRAVDLEMKNLGRTEMGVVKDWCTEKARKLGSSKQGSSKQGQISLLLTNL